MDLLEKSLAVREVFEALELETRAYLSQSQLTCFAGCGLCCTNPKVSATILEFLPLAFDLYQKGRAEEFFDVLENTSSDQYCIILKRLTEEVDSGMCSDYRNRGMICRLFGSAARRNREGKKELITCKKLKEGKKALFETANTEINQSMQIPLASDYYGQLYNIDFYLTKEEYPINKAIQKALEAVLQYYYYHGNQAV
ncbi:YkgJ family cysteine cluster protein [Pararhodonellum marinum]|uniref:YkgJ family cysteine cluster protein n=1 Tax=Pararhodonellum marinum TaxID=2755358 RepID=UPI00188DD5A6|nr:YkgJ family cysteine cluster protein [Pararhodonellum marinum]